MRVPVKVQDVMLRDPKMLEQLPRRVRNAGRLLSANRCRNVRDRAIEPDVGVFPRKKLGSCSLRGASLVMGGISNEERRTKNPARLIRRPQTGPDQFRGPPSG